MISLDAQGARHRQGPAPLGVQRPAAQGAAPDGALLAEVARDGHELLNHSNHSDGEI